eukprot:g19557.t1
MKNGGAPAHAYTVHNGGAAHAYTVVHRRSSSMEKRDHLQLEETNKVKYFGEQAVNAIGDQAGKTWNAVIPGQQATDMIHWVQFFFLDDDKEVIAVVKTTMLQSPDHESSSPREGKTGAENVRSWGVLGDRACAPTGSLSYTCELLLRRDFHFGNPPVDPKRCNDVLTSSDLVQVAGWSPSSTHGAGSEASKGAAEWSALAQGQGTIRDPAVTGGLLQKAADEGTPTFTCYQWKPPENEPSHEYKKTM